MLSHSWLARLTLVLPSLALLASAAVQPPPAPPADPRTLARLWDTEHVSPPLPPLLDHAEVGRRLDRLVEAAPDLFVVEPIGQSVEGRAIRMLRAGSGRRVVLLWSQMHGDEPTATAALFDLFEWLRRHRSEAAVRQVLAELTLYAIPMLNPDGAERFQRRNAQGIDINRDALRLQTPEGRALKDVRDRLQPMLGFNLHNQNWRTSVGSPPEPAAISLLSVAFDDARTENEGRRLTKRLCAVIRDALEPLAAGRIGRYDDEFEVRAFGDNITLWGTPVVLIETGPVAGDQPDATLVRLNFVALVSALQAVASGAVAAADPARYEELPVNDNRELHTILRNATVIAGTGIPPFTADVGLLVTRKVVVVDGRRELQQAMTVDDLGDLRTLGALHSVDATGMTVVPLGGEDVHEGDVVALPEWRTVFEAGIVVNTPARLALLRPAGEPGRYQVAMVVR
jgi:Zinc carboxypeptidase